MPALLWSAVLQEAAAAVGEQCAALAQEEAGVRVEIEVLGKKKYKV